jgi:hypothetical protein
LRPANRAAAFCGRGALIRHVTASAALAKIYRANPIGTRFLRWAVSQLPKVASEQISRLAANLFQGFESLALCCQSGGTRFSLHVYWLDAVNDHFVAPGIA